MCPFLRRISSLAFLTSFCFLQIFSYFFVFDVNKKNERMNSNSNPLIVPSTPVPPPPPASQLGNLVFLSARPHVYKDMSESKSYAKFKKLQVHDCCVPCVAMIWPFLGTHRCYVAHDVLLLLFPI